jgi:hypothetical protein
MYSTNQMITKGVRPEQPFPRPSPTSGFSVNHAGQVVLKLKTPYRNGTSHIVMSPLEFMQRPAALVPRPRIDDAPRGS